MILLWLLLACDGPPLAPQTPGELAVTDACDRHCAHDAACAEEPREDCIEDCYAVARGQLPTEACLIAWAEVVACAARAECDEADTCHALREDLQTECPPSINPERPVFQGG